MYSVLFTTIYSSGESCFSVCLQNRDNVAGCTVQFVWLRSNIHAEKCLITLSPDLFHSYGCFLKLPLLSSEHIYCTGKWLSTHYNLIMNVIADYFDADTLSQALIKLHSSFSLIRASLNICQRLYFINAQID